MMKLFKARKTYGLFTLLLAGLFIAGCGDGGKTGHWLPAPHNLMSIEVTPATASVPITGAQFFTATAIYSDGSTSNVTTSSDWGSGTLGVATVGLNTGIATGVAAGQSVITATFGGMSGSATLTVNSATSTMFQVIPSTGSIPVSGTQQFKAIETFSDGTNQDRTADSAWSSPDLVPVGAAGVATIDNTVGSLTRGKATGVKPGTSTITAKYTVSGITKTATAILTVNAATSVSFAVTSPTASIPVTGTQQYTAIETFSDGTSQDRTADSAWSSPDLVPVGAAGVATIDNTVGSLTRGKATGVKPGTSTITAAYGVYTGAAAKTAILTVTAATSRKFEVIPATAEIPVTGTQTYTAIETFSDGTTADRTLTSTWSSDNATVATVAVDNGIATGRAVGTALITATYAASPFSPASATLTVTAPTPGPAGPAVDLGTASTYGIIASTAMTIPSSDLAHIYGDVAITDTDAFTGFALTGTTALPHSIYVTPKTNTATNTGINSTVHGDTAAIPQLKIDLLAAYNDLWNRVPAANALVATQASVTGKGGGTFPAGGTDISGLVLIPGTYKFGAAAASDTIGLSNAAVGPLVLDAKGNPDAVFVFIASDITTTTNNVILQGGAQAKNVFWVMTATANIGNGGVNIFQGTVVAGTAIVVDGTNVQGRMLAGATIGGPLTITAAGSTITVPE